MSATRHTRASRRAAAGSSSSGRIASDADASPTPNVSTRKTPQGIKSNITKHTRSNKASNESDTSQDGSTVQNGTIDEEDDNQDDDEQEDVHAPSLTPLPPRDKLDELNLSGGSQKPWTGHPNNDRDDLMELDEIKAEPTHADVPAESSPQDDLFALAAELDGSGSEGDDESEIDIDDDNYDDVDNISNSSEESDQIEAAFEQEINVNGIDWDDANTYAYDGSWQNHPYGLSIELAVDDSPLKDEFLAWQAAEKEKEGQVTPGQNEYKPVPAKVSFDDGFSTSDSDSTSRSRASNAATENANGKLSRVSSLDNDDEGESTEEDIPQVPSPSTIPSSNPRRPPRKVEYVEPGTSYSSSRSSSFSSEDRSGVAIRHKKPKKYPIWRRIRVSRDKALGHPIVTPAGTIMTFKVPKHLKLRWVSADNSRTTSPTMSSSTSMEVDTPGASQPRVIDSVIQGRLFQEAFCSPSVTPLPQVSNHSSEFARNPFLSNVFKPLLGGASNRQLKDSVRFFLENDQSDDDNDDDLTFALVDFGEEDDFDFETKDNTPTTTPNTSQQRPALLEASDLDAGFDPESLDLFLIPRGEDTSAALEDDDEAESPEDLDDLYEAQLTSPRKRRASDRQQERTSLSPIFKRQKLGAANEVSV